MPLCDTHCHLQDDRIFHQLDRILSDASEKGVQAYICNGSSTEDWERVAQISSQNPKVIPAFGLHPWYVDDAPDNWFRELQHVHERITAVVGEIGLDLMFKKKSKFENQETTFRKQIQLAVELKRPVSIHCLKAWHILQPILKEYKSAGIPVQLHSYNGGPGPVGDLVALGCYFSFSGSLTRSRNTKAHEAIKIIPLERLLFETDASDIPLEIDGQIDTSVPNQPGNLGRVLVYAAQLLQMDVDTLAEQAWNNSFQFLAPLALKPENFSQEKETNHDQSK